MWGVEDRSVGTEVSGWWKKRKTYLVAVFESKVVVLDVEFEVGKDQL